MTTRSRFAIWAALSGAVAVLFAGIIAIGVVDQSLRSVVDDRIDAVAANFEDSMTTAQACARVGAAAGGEGRRRTIAVLAEGREACRSSPAAPSPRALGVDVTSAGADADADIGIETRDIEGLPWRLRVTDLGDGRALIVADLDEVGRRASANSRRAIFIAMGVGALFALVVGIVASVPATRRISRLLDRIARASRDPRRHERVAGGLGRDLDAAAHEFDELLDGVRAAEDSQRRLFADAAHQLRTPVTSIRTNAQLLERHPSLDDDARDIATRLAGQAAVIGGLVSGLVDYAAVPAWSRDRSAPSALAVLAQDAADRAAARWPELAISVDADDSTAVVDAELVVRALGNLVDNSTEHGSGTVRIVVADGVVAVEDDGSGFDPEIVDRAFEPFAYGQGGGAGIGLAFVAHVAQAHGGTARIVPGPPTRVELDLR